MSGEDTNVTWDGLAARTEVLQDEIAAADGTGWPDYGEPPWQLYTSAAALAYGDGHTSVTCDGGVMVIADIEAGMFCTVRGVWLSGQALHPEVRFVARGRTPVRGWRGRLARWLLK